MGMISNTARFAALAILFGAMAWAGVREGLKASVNSGNAVQMDGVGPDSTEAPRPDTLEVLVMLPFGLQVDTLPGGFLPRKTKRLREIALESLHGLECAAEALAFYGIPVTLDVVDEVPDSSGRVALAQRDLVKSDVVFGPLMRENVAVVLPRIDRLRKEHVLLTEQPYRHLERGMHVRQAVSSELEAAGVLASMVAAKHDTDNVVLVVTGGSDAALEKHFQATFDAAQRAKWLTAEDSARYALLDTVHGSTRSVGALAMHLTPYERNVVVGMAGRNSRSMWAALQTELQMNDSSDVLLYAHPELAEMPFVEGALMEAWKLTLPQTNQVLWQDSTRWEGLSAYRNLTGMDPDKYATLAHDALIDVGRRMHPWAPTTTWARAFEWAPSPDSASWHNTAWDVMRFEALAWKPLDSCAATLPFEPQLFYTEEDSLIPVPDRYQHLFPEEYPDAIKTAPRP